MTLEMSKLADVKKKNRKTGQKKSGKTSNTTKSGKPRKSGKSDKREKAPALAVPEASEETVFGSSRIEEQLKEAELETDELQRELARLDDEWNEKIKQLEAAKPSASVPDQPEVSKSEKTESSGDKKPSDSMTNVISMANRIRSLQKDIKG